MVDVNKDKPVDFLYKPSDYSRSNKGATLANQ